MTETPQERPSPSVRTLKLHHLRCFPRLEAEFPAGRVFIVGPNARGKTSILEALTLLFRLQSPRTNSLKTVIAHGQRGFAVQGQTARHLLQFYYGERRRKLAIDGVEQTAGAGEYLKQGAVVFLANSDLELVQGAAEKRRRLLDFLASQCVPGYRESLRDYTRALKQRNALLRAAWPVNWRQVDAFTPILAREGAALAAARRELAARLAPEVLHVQRHISGGDEPELRLEYFATAGEDLARALEESRAEDARLRQTSVGPHRDDLLLTLGGAAVGDFASEGQQRTAALALKMAQMNVITAESGRAPLLLIDDVFGELDPRRRNALFTLLPAGQHFITTTSLDWLDPAQRPAEGLFHLREGRLQPGPATGP
jgi:DNA replication and repair protein RecF